MGGESSHLEGLSYVQNNSIKQRVLDAVTARLNSLQAEYDSECKRLDEELEEKKVKLADKMVDSVVSKIL